MSAEFYGEMKDVADELIEEFGADVTISRAIETGPEYDVNTGFSNTQTTKAVEVTEYVQQRDNGLAPGVTAVYLCTLPTTFDLKLEDQFTGFGGTYRVVTSNTIKPGNVKVVVEVGVGA